MQTAGEERDAGGKESLTRVGALFLIAVAAMLVVGFQFVNADKDDAPAIEGMSLSEE